MKRIGFVGLSTPSFYDYRTQASKGPADQSSSPNPIIEGAFGAILLYDEIWFLSRSLCPENMRDLSYIKFLDEKDRLPDIDPSWLPDPKDVFQPEALQAFSKSSSAYHAVKNQAHVYWDAAADNHTHGLRIGGYDLNGNSWSVKNVLHDIAITDRLPNNVELITNSFTSTLFRTEARVGQRLQLTEELILDNVPQFLSPLGPYHPCIEEVRNSPYLSYFRSWIGDTAFSSENSDLKEIKKETEAKLAESQRLVFLKHLDPAGSYKSLAETAFGLGLDALIPMASTIGGLVAQRNAEREKQGIRWQGFILDAKAKIAGKRTQP